MKKALPFIAATAVVLVCIVLIAINKEKGISEDQNNTEQGETRTWAGPSIDNPIEGVINHVLDSGLYEGCSIEKLYSEFDSCFTTYSTDEDLIEAFIKKTLEDNPTVIKSDKKVVETGDFLKIQYLITDASTGKEMYFEPHETAQCGGMIYHFSQIFESLEGHTVGEKYYLNNFIDADLSDRSMVCEIIPLYIYTLEPAVLDDAFVQKNTKYNTVAEWRDFLRNEYEIINRENAWETSLSILISNSTFALNEELLIENASQKAAIDVANAKNQGIELAEYVEETYKISYQEYLLSLYGECEREVKEYLVVNAVADLLGFTASSDDIKEKVQQMQLQPVDLSTEELLAICYLILRDKVVNYFTKPAQ